MSARIGWLDLEPEDDLPGISWESFKTEHGLDGSPDPAPVAVFMAAAALAAVRAHASSSPEAEIGGILYGRAFDLDDVAAEIPAPAKRRIVVDVVAALAAHGADGSPAHLTFTPAAWDQVFAQRRDLAGDLDVVGWYHSHPGLGVFLSGTDLRTQAAFFGKPWQVAIVLDPCGAQEGTFVGPAGTRIQLHLYSPVAIPPASRPPTARLVLVACGILAGLLGWAVARLAGQSPRSAEPDR